MASTLVVAALLYGATKLPHDTSERLQPKPSEISCGRFTEEPSRSSEVADDVAEELDPNQAVNRDELALEVAEEIDSTCEQESADYRPVNRDLNRTVIRKFRKLQR